MNHDSLNWKWRNTDRKLKFSWVYWVSDQRVHTGTWLCIVGRHTFNVGLKGLKIDIYILSLGDSFNQARYIHVSRSN